MSTSQRAFNQVKSILDKLDRSIDEARAKRLDTSEDSATQTVGRPVLGRAQPLRPAHRNAGLDRWTS